MASKFELEGMIYEQNEKGNRFYKWDANEKANTKKRIPEAEFEDAFDKYWDDDYQKRKDKEKHDDREAEKAVNKKTKKVRAKKNKDDLTDKQQDFIKHIPDCSFYENGLDSTVWTDVLADEIGGQFCGKPMTVGAMISTLREKEIIAIGEDKVNGKRAKFLSFTDLGKKVAKKLGLK